MSSLENPASLHHNLETALSTAKTPRRFAHLHQHTQYSLLDGAARVKDLLKWVAKTAESNPAVAMTDHGNMHGAVQFFKYAQEYSVKPIIGYEAYVSAGSRFDRISRASKGMEGGYYHLTLLAKDFTGYQNLCRLASRAYLEGFYVKPRIDREILASHKEGIIAMSGCLGAEVPNMILNDRLPEAEERLRWYLDTFGDDYYIEIQNHGLPEQQKVNPVLKEWAKKYGIGMVATNDGHYVKSDDAYAHEVLLAIQTKALMSEEDRFKFPCNDFYVKTPEELEERLPSSEWGDEIYDNSVEIAEKCNLELPIGSKRKYQMPALPIPEGRSMAEELRVQVYQGTRARFPETFTLELMREYAALSLESLEASRREKVLQRLEVSRDAAASDLERVYLTLAFLGTEWVEIGEAAGDKYTPYPALDRLEETSGERLGQGLVILRRAEYESGVIIRMGFPDYFLIVADFINWAKDHGIRVGPGRGSGAGSLVAYALKITNLDPLRYGLLFERFLNPDRISMPDFDVDFSDTRRGEVINYVRDKYGDDKVAMIATYGTMSSRACFKDVARVLELPFQEADKLSKLVPVVFGRALSLEKARETVPDIQKMLDESENARKVFEIAQSLEGLTRHSSVHASGVVIGREPLDNLVPLMRAGGDEGVVCQYDMNSVEDIGLIKMDFLGLRTLSFLEEAVRIIKDSKGVSLEPDDFPLDDPKTYEVVSRGETKGIFQLEGSGITDAARKLKPRRIEDINALSALYRPGPMENIPAYIERHHGREAVRYDEGEFNLPKCEPLLRPILEETYGIPVYQEQIMQIASAVAGYSLGQSDLLRRCVAKGTLVVEANTGRRIPIEGIKPGTQVLSLAPDYRLVNVPVQETIHNGLMRVYQVRTRAGRRLKLTHDHPLLTVSGWKHLSDLKVGDAIATPSSLPVIGTQQPAQARVKLLGYLIGDGGTLQNGKPCANFYNSDEAVLGDYERAAAEFGVLTTRYVHAGTGVTTVTARGVVRNGLNSLTKLVIKTDLAKLAHEKRIPLEVFEYDRAALQTFIACLWATDGSVEQKRLSYSSASKALLDDIAHLLLRFGVNCIRRHGKTTHRDKHELVITDQLDVARFSQAFAAHIVGYKRERLGHLAEEAALRSRNTSIYDVPSEIGYAIKTAKTSSGRTWREAGELVGVTGSHLSSGLNLQTPNRALSRHRLSTLAAGFSSEDLRVLSENDVLWDVILEITDVGETEVFDLAVPPFANFVCADVIVHNSMGKKKVDEMARERVKFVEGAKQTNGIPAQESENLFNILEKFANYGFNKCVVGSTLVVDSRTGRRVKILDIMQGREANVSVPSLCEPNLKIIPKPVTDAFSSGHAMTYRLETETGRSLQATGNHPVYTSDGWKHLDDVKPGEFIAVPRHLPYTASASLQEHELVLLGYALSEGNLCHPSGLYLYAKLEDEIADMVTCLEQFENSAVKLDRSKSAASLYAKRLDRRFESGAVAFLRGVGTLGLNALNKHVPEIVFQLPKTQIALFLGRLWTGDGGVQPSTRLIHYATSSHALAVDVQHLLLRLGVQSRIHAKRSKYRGSIREGYTVHVLGGPEGARAFAETVGTHLVGKRARDLGALLKTYLIDEDTRSSKDVLPNSFLPALEAELRWAAQQSDLSYGDFMRGLGFRSGPDLLRVKTKGRGLSRRTLERLAAQLPTPMVQKHAASEIYWDAVVSLEPAGVQEVFDLTIAGTHNFVANDIVVHNSHSAAYAFITFQTAYIKAHYPVEFMASLLTVERRNSDKVAEYINDARQTKLESGELIQVLPPDINRSSPDFKVQGEQILFGLFAVKSLGEETVLQILEEREKNGAFKSLANFCSRLHGAGLNRRALENLVKAGAFDAFGSRDAVLESVEEALDYAAGQSAMANQGMDSLFGMATIAPEPKLRTVPAPRDENEARARAIQQLQFEKEAVGLYISGHPLEHYPGMLEAASTKVPQMESWFRTSTAPVGYKGRKRAVLAGMISGIQRKPTKSGGMMARFILTDDMGAAELVAFSRAYDKINLKLREDAPALVIVELEPDGDEGIRATVEDLLPYEDAKEMPKILALEVNLDRVDAAQFQQLDDLLQVQDGIPNIPIRVRVLSPDGFEDWELDQRATVSTLERLQAECPWLKVGLGIDGEKVLAKFAPAPKPWERNAANGGGARTLN